MNRESGPTSPSSNACDVEHAFEKPEVNHRLHLIATILTAGLWGVGWLATALYARIAPWKCRGCKSREQDNRDRATLIGRACREAVVSPSAAKSEAGWRRPQLAKEFRRHTMLLTVCHAVRILPGNDTPSD